MMKLVSLCSYSATIGVVLESNDDELRGRTILQLQLAAESNGTSADDYYGHTIGELSSSVGSASDYNGAASVMTGIVTIKQPAENKGNYKDRSWNQEACTLVGQCKTLDSMRCKDTTLCLKWGDDCYAGMATAPAGMKIIGYHLYGAWDNPCTGDDTVSHSFKPEGGDWRFFTGERVCAFKFELEAGHTCEACHAKCESGRYSKSGPCTQCVNPDGLCGTSDDYCHVAGAHNCRTCKPAITYSDPTGHWQKVFSGGDISQTLTRGLQRSNSQTTTTSDTVGVAIAAAATVGGKVGFKPLGVGGEASASGTVTLSGSYAYTWSTAVTTGSTVSESTQCTSACKRTDLPEGSKLWYMYQWVMEATGSDGQIATVKSCNTKCVPVKQGGLNAPVAPLGCCLNDACDAWLTTTRCKHTTTR